MGIITSLIAGALAGFITGKIMGLKSSLLFTVILGLAGGLVGKVVFRLFGFAAVSMLGTIIASAIGGCILVVIVRAIAKKK